MWAKTLDVISLVRNYSSALRRSRGKLPTAKERRETFLRKEEARKKRQVRRLQFVGQQVRNTNYLQHLANTIHLKLFQRSYGHESETIIKCNGREDENLKTGNVPQKYCQTARTGRGQCLSPESWCLFVEGGGWRNVCHT